MARVQDPSRGAGRLTELHTTPGNPPPPRGAAMVVRTRDGFALRAARWSVSASRGTVTIVAGRSEMIEHYYEVVGALLGRGFDVVAFDWRGQGASDHETGWTGLARRGQRPGHVSSFNAYRRDLAAVEAQVLRPLAAKPWYALGHSMGAAVLLDQAHDGLSPFDRLVLTAPMIGLGMRRRRGVHRLLRLLTGAGLGAFPIPGGHHHTILNRPFEANILTTSRRRYRRMVAAAEHLPGLAVGAPTLRWAAKAMDAMAKFEDPRYPLAIAKPVLIVAAGADRIVDTAATERFAARLRVGDFITIPDARHQIMAERDGIVAQFWAAFDAFIPGQPMPPDIDERAWARFAPEGDDRPSRWRRAAATLAGR